LNCQRLDLPDLSQQLLESGLPTRVFSLTGGGGKTSLMLLWAACLRASGYSVVATTTTKLAAQPHAGCRIVPAATWAGAVSAVAESIGQDKPIILVSDQSITPGKLAGIPPAWIDALSIQFPDIFFLVEADGSAGRSVKGYQAYEPVIPARTALLMPVIGLDALAQPINSQQVHRPELFCRISGSEPGLPISAAAITSALLHADGYLHNVPTTTLILPLLNIVETRQQYRQCRELAALILAANQPQICAVLAGSVQNDCFVRLS
jgi:probable selenium-dependent hydroxylase accessory protein YqeC